MSRGHWSKLRAKGMGPRGGGGGHLKGPLRRIVAERNLYTVSGVRPGKPLANWRNYETVFETFDATAAGFKCRELIAAGWPDVRVTGPLPREVLECGHVRPPVSDLVGRTNAARRRCPRCKEGKPADPLGADYIK